MAGDKPFLASGNKTKRRVHDFIAPLPEYIPCPPHEVQKKEKVDDAPPPFRLTHHY